MLTYCEILITPPKSPFPKKITLLRFQAAMNFEGLLVTPQCRENEDKGHTLRGFYDLSTLLLTHR